MISVPSTEIAQLSAKVMALGQKAADSSSDLITKKLIETMKDYYDGVDALGDVTYEAREEGYDSVDEYIKDSDDFYVLINELIGSFEKGFNMAWFHEIGGIV